jgi:hypothetical protein
MTTIRFHKIRLDAQVEITPFHREGLTLAFLEPGDDGALLPERVTWAAIEVAARRIEGKAGTVIVVPCVWDRGDQSWFANDGGDFPLQRINPN